MLLLAGWLQSPDFGIGLGARSSKCRSSAWRQVRLQRISALLHNGSPTYTNLYWPGGSPQTASDYPLHGGFLDIYGLLFDIGGGRVVDLWSNGDLSGTGNGPIDYGAAVATQARAMDYVSNGVSIGPEPSAFVLLGIGLAGMLAWRRDPLRSRLNR